MPDRARRSAGSRRSGGWSSSSADPFPSTSMLPGAAASRAGIHIRHPREVRRTWHRGLPVVPLSQALLVATGDLRHDSLRLVLARAEYRRLLRLTDLHAALGPGRPGSTARPRCDGRSPSTTRRLRQPISRSTSSSSASASASQSRSPTPGSGAGGPTCSGGRPGWSSSSTGGTRTTPPRSSTPTGARAEALRRRGFTVIRYSVGAGPPRAGRRRRRPAVPARIGSRASWT